RCARATTPGRCRSWSRPSRSSVAPARPTRHTPTTTSRTHASPSDAATTSSRCSTPRNGSRATGRRSTRSATTRARPADDVSDEQPMVDRPPHDARPRTDTELPHRGTPVHLDGAKRERQEVGDLAVRVAVGDQQRHFVFARRQLRGRGRPHVCTVPRTRGERVRDNPDAVRDFYAPSRDAYCVS